VNMRFKLHIVTCSRASTCCGSSDGSGSCGGGGGSGVGGGGGSRSGRSGGSAVRYTCNTMRMIHACTYINTDTYMNT